nr:hypothetical protein [Tanacetum cinerariifolium]
MMYLDFGDLEVAHVSSGLIILVTRTLKLAFSLHIMLALECERSTYFYFTLSNQKNTLTCVNDYGTGIEQEKALLYK